LLQTEGTERIFIEADKVCARGKATGNALDLLCRVERLCQLPCGDADTLISAAGLGAQATAPIAPKLS
jgi:hypothetical protein